MTNKLNQNHAEDIALTIINKLRINPLQTATYITAFGFTVKAIIDDGVIRYYFEHAMNNEIANMVGLILNRFNDMLVEQRQEKIEPKEELTKPEIAPIKKAFTKIKYKRVK